MTRAGIELETGFALVGARQSSVYTATLSPHTLELEQTHGEIFRSKFISFPIWNRLGLEKIHFEKLF